jgi:UDP-glucose 4-epimerase
MSILITGGAGYIGSHTLKELIKQGHKPLVLDNLSEGHRGAVKDVELTIGDLADRQRVLTFFRNNHIESVIHFAAHCYVGESVENPLKYYRNNIASVLNLFEAMIEKGVKNFIFSSTAAVYGEPCEIPIPESHPQNPINPYGETKLAVEKLLQYLQKSHGIQSVALRYFNAAGADKEGIIGEDHNPETHLIPLVLQVANGKREFISIFGDDYDTPDGTCIRDYIHVTDLAQAHIAALDYLESGGKTEIFNVGIGQGFSVKEVVDMARAVTGEPIPSVITTRRAGDPARLVADVKKIHHVLKWNPRYTELESIIETAWSWHKNHRDGFPD